MSNDQSTRPQTSVAGCFVRIYWMFLGNAVPLFSAIMLATNQGSRIALIVVYWTGIAALLLARFVEFRCSQGVLTDDRPAGTRDLLRYTFIVLLAGAATFLAAFSLAP